MLRLAGLPVSPTAKGSRTKPVWASIQEGVAQGPAPLSPGPKPPYPEASSCNIPDQLWASASYPIHLPKCLCYASPGMVGALGPDQARSLGAF